MLTRERRQKALKQIQSAAKPVFRNSDGQDFRCEITAEDDNTITIAIRGVVGDSWEGNDHSTIVEHLEANPKKDVYLKINSMGGSVFDGFGIANALLSHEGQVTAIIEGVAYSAASFITVAADKVIAHKASTYGIHRSLTFTYGNQVEHAATIEALNAIDDILIDLYVERTSKSREEIVDLLDGTVDGTMMKAVDAKEHGFVDEIYEPKKKGGKAKDKDKDKDKEDKDDKKNVTSQLQEIKLERARRLRKVGAEQFRRRLEHAFS